MRRAMSLAVALASLTLTACGTDRAADAQTWRTLTSERQVQDREPLQVQIQYGAGTLSIVPADAPTLYRYEIRYDEEIVSPTVSYDESRRFLRLGLQSESAVTRRSRRHGREGSAAAVSLSREVPIELNLEFGAGRADLQLGGISLSRLAVSTGASETTIAFGEPNPITAERISIESGAADLRVQGLGNARASSISFQGGVGATMLDFSGDWNGDANASVQMGVGSVTLRLPRSQGVRINRSSFLTSFSAPGMEREGNSYFSSNWSTAAHRLTIELSAALGSVDVRWVD
jgi:hypothetical protein